MVEPHFKREVGVAKTIKMYLWFSNKVSKTSKIWLKLLKISDLPDQEHQHWILEDTRPIILHLCNPQLDLRSQRKEVIIIIQTQEQALLPFQASNIKTPCNMVNLNILKGMNKGSWINYPTNRLMNYNSNLIKINQTMSHPPCNYQGDTMASD